MGLFSSIGKVIGKVAKPLATVAGFASNPLVGFGADALGGLWSAKQTKDSASKAMRYQTRMSNTSYQRGMADMKAAGLNPILAYKQGGASVPQGQAPSIGNPISHGVSSAISQQRVRAEVDNLQATNKQIRTNTQKSFEEALRLRLENKAYEQLSPQQRLLYMSANPAAAGVSAARGLRNLLKKGN